HRAFAVGTNVVGVVLAVLAHFHGGAEVETGVLRVAIEADFFQIGLKKTVEVDEDAVAIVGNSEFAFLGRKGLAVLAAPEQLALLTAMLVIGFLADHAVMEHELAVAAVP